VVPLIVGVPPEQAAEQLVSGVPKAAHAG